MTGKVHLIMTTDPDTGNPITLAPDCTMTDDCPYCTPETRAERHALVEELRGANPKEFGRPAVPTVYADYEEFLATGRYPYNADVEAFITARHDVPDDLARHLAHEVYLAAGQHKVAKMAATEAAARAEGWIAITEVEPTVGLVLDIRGMSDGPFRVKPTGKDWAPWALLAKGKRTHGYDFARLVEQHRAYEKAKERGQVAMDGPVVVMVRTPQATS